MGIFGLWSSATWLYKNECSIGTCPHIEPKFNTLTLLIGKLRVHFFKAAWTAPQKVWKFSLTLD